MRISLSAPALLAIALATPVTACGRSATSPAAREDAAPASPEDARRSAALPPEGARRPHPERALLDALSTMSADGASWKWIDRAASSRGSRADEPPPRVREAVAALLAWDRSGSPFSVSCSLEGGSPSGWVGVARLSTAVLALADGADDPAVHAVLRLGHALRDPQNMAAAAAIGTAISVAAAHWLRDLGLHPTPDFTALAPHPDTALHAARADMRCAIEWAEQLHLGWKDELAGASPFSGGQEEDAATPGAAASSIGSLEAKLEAKRRAMNLPNDPGWVEAELPTWRAFWRETEDLVARARSVDELLAIHAARRTAMGQHPTSLLLRTLSDVLLTRKLPGVIQALVEQTRAYRETIAALAP